MPQTSNSLATSHLQKHHCFLNIPKLKHVLGHSGQLSCLATPLPFEFFIKCQIWHICQICQICTILIDAKHLASAKHLPAGKKLLFTKCLLTTKS